MGLIRCGPTTEIISKLRETYDVRTFIETGTYTGATSNWASQEFERVITIEKSETLYRKVIENYSNRSNIEFLLGDSRDRLNEIVPKLNSPVIFWLDAHWSGGETYGEADECPLIGEIQAITQSCYKHFIFIDDARLFMSPPPLPHKIDEWPSIDMVIRALSSASDGYYIIISEDVIISVPCYAKQLVASHCQEINTQIWEDHIKFQNESRPTRALWTHQALRFVKRGLILTLKHLKLLTNTNSL